MIETTKTLPILSILQQAYAYLSKHEKKLRPFWLVHLVFCALFNVISNGLSNPLSLIVCIFYYIFWCVFFRFYYQKKPYFEGRKILASAVPSSKMIFITVALLLFLLFVPFLPLLLGFDNAYLPFFEKYMALLQAPEAGLINIGIFSLIFLSISPFAFSRPFLAWISALQGYSGLMRKVFQKTRGNNVQFFKLMFLLQVPCFLIFLADNGLGCHGWLSVCFYSVYLIYFNLVFAKVYDFFYDVKSCGEDFKKAC
ncbi:MAG: hypothetical protein IJS26_00940 [Alphaproteobacteria bacterium]|nr:hypothetical protein [Alphaproteobacteria bacterium]